MNIFKKRRYYFVSYAHKSGFGRSTVSISGYFRMNDVEDAIAMSKGMRSTGSGVISIISYKRITKGTFKRNEVMKEAA